MRSWLADRTRLNLTDSSLAKKGRYIDNRGYRYGSLLRPHRSPLEIVLPSCYFSFAQAVASLRAACFCLFASSLAGGWERVGPFASLLHRRRK